MTAGAGARSVARVGAAVLALAAGAGATAAAAATLQPLRPSEVDPLIGTGGAGATFPGAALPFGLVAASPDTGLDLLGGYHDPASSTLGISHRHMSGGGCPDVGEVRLLPVTGPLEGVSAAVAPLSGEVARPGRWSGRVGGIRVDVAATTRAAVHRYRFPAGDFAGLVVDLSRNGADAAATSPNRYTAAVAGGELAGTVRPRWGFCGRHAGATSFALRASVPFTATPIDGGILLTFAQPADVVSVRVGISLTGPDGARRNLDAEAPTASVEDVAARATQAWKRALGRVSVAAPERRRRLLATALYHALLGPTTADDVDGAYTDIRGRAARTTGRHFVNLSLWDTYRAQMPLLALVEPAAAADVVWSLLADQRDCRCGRFPRWPMHGGDARLMSGDPAVAAIADAVARGAVRRSARPAVLAAVRRDQANQRATRDLDRPGWVSLERTWARDLYDRPVGASWTLEQGVAAHAAARVAALAGDVRLAQRWARRAGAWRSLVDPASRWIRPRHSNGTRLEPFLLRSSQGFEETSSIQASWNVPHDLPGLVAAMGGVDLVLLRLRAFLTSTGGPGSVDPTQRDAWDPGNEPTLHVPAMPVLLGEPALGQFSLRRALDNWWTASPDGIPGNDDLGTLSSWYVLASLGLVAGPPGDGTFTVVSPAVDRALIPGALDLRSNGVASRPYVAAATVGGHPLRRPVVRARGLALGLSLQMNGAPQPLWARPGDEPTPSRR